MAEEGAEIRSTAMLLAYCVKLLTSDAWLKMGLLAEAATDGEEGSTNPDLAQAKLAIDAVSDLIDRLAEAPDVDISQGQRRELRDILNDLRLNYVSLRSA